MVFDDEMTLADVGECLGVSESRISQIVTKRIEPAVTQAYALSEALDLYRDDPEYSQLVIDWIAI